MKILINLRELTYKGGVVQIFRTLQLNNNNNIDYFIISKENVKNKFVFLINRYILFYKIIKQYDIVHINPSFSKTALWRDLVFLLIAKHRNKKVLVFMHGWEDEYEKKIKTNKLLLQIFKKYNKADAFFVLGNIFKQKLISLGISENKKFYLETTIADDRYINDFNINEKIHKFYKKDKTIKFIFISRITSGKGMNLAIDIFNKVQVKSSRKMELIIAGDGDKLEETKEYVKQNNIKNIVFAGYIKDEAKHKILKNCDIMLFPTMYGEGLPNSVLEGMLYGMPIISRVNAGIPDWVQNNENGFITKSTNPDDFIPFINMLLSDKYLYAKIVINNHKLAKENFTRQVITKRFLEHYKEVFNA